LALIIYQFGSKAISSSDTLQLYFASAKRKNADELPELFLSI
jgi:hypothetical protein